MDTATTARSTRKRARAEDPSRSSNLKESIRKGENTVGTRVPPSGEGDSSPDKSKSAPVAPTSSELTSTKDLVTPPSKSRLCTGKKPTSAEGGKGNRSQGKGAQNGQPTTRSRNPRSRSDDERRRVSKRAATSDVEEALVEQTISMDSGACILAMADERSYNRCLLGDANGVASDVLLPMSLPWTHNTIPVTRNIPCDIDEMTEILTADDGSRTPFENGPFGFGRFDVGQLRRGPRNSRLATSSDSWCVASRRCEDPGTMELRTVSLPLNPPVAPLVSQPNSSRRIDRIQECRDGRHPAPGELALQCFELAQKRKRRKLTEVRSCARKQVISVKVNSSSSRSSIFASLEERLGRKEIPCLEAVLPAEVQSGRFLSLSRAQKIADILGTYNVRHMLGPTNKSGKNANRVSCGRTRLIWTEKSPADQPQRVFFTSLVTGARLESGTQRRPRQVKVAIRLDGRILDSNALLKKRNSNEGNEMDDLVAESQTTDVTRSNSRGQCALHCDQFVRNVLKGPLEKHLGLKQGGSHTPVLPQLECLPDSNGAIHTVCSSPGEISLGSVHEALNDAARTSSVCTVCWTSEGQGTEGVRVCSQCKVRVHVQCCYDCGELSQGEDGEMLWKCGACMMPNATVDEAASDTGPEFVKKSRRKSRPPPWLKDSQYEPTGSSHIEAAPGSVEPRRAKCALCPYTGGAMSLVERNGERVWIHEVCRIWSKNDYSPQQATQDGVKRKCALCGSGHVKSSASGKANGTSPVELPYVGLVKCAHSRCLVHFHPMCAILNSKLPREMTTTCVAVTPDGQVEKPALPRAKEIDIELCTQFTLTALECEAVIGNVGKDPGTIETLTVPVGFCGVHNPKREPGFRGLYPGGAYMDYETMHIPPASQK